MRKYKVHIIKRGIITGKVKTKKPITKQQAEKRLDSYFKRGKVKGVSFKIKELPRSRLSKRK